MNGAAATPEAERWLIIDTDAGIDDAQALVLALRCAARHGVHIAAITCTNGNARLSNVVGNVCAVLHALGVPDGTVPVYVGASHPLVRRTGSSDGVAYHGDDGLGGTGLARSCAAAGRRCDILALAPLTTVALAARLAPSVTADIRTVYVMGGAHSGRGNATMTAEFNVHEDPEAAEVVFSSFPSIVMIGWEVTLSACLSDTFLREWFTHSTSEGRFLSTVSAHLVAACAGQSPDKFAVPDPLACAVALDASIATRTAHHAVFVETAGALTRGMTVVDWSDLYKGSDRARVTIVEAVDQGALQRMLLESVGKPVSLDGVV